MRAARSVVTDSLRGIVAAFQFLTRLPVPIPIAYNDAVFRRSVVFYPLVGAAIGLLLYACGYWLGAVAPPGPTAAVVLALWVALTGALHLDGLMDTADGTMSHRSRERMLEIMKDSRVGAMGVVAGVLALLAKYACLTALLVWRDEPAFALLIAAPVWSRWFMSASIACWPYARQEGGLGASFRGVGKRHAAAGLALAVFATAAVLYGSGLSPAHAIATLAAFAIAAALCGTLVNVWLTRKLGGLTGDTYGAANELIETALLLAAVVLLPYVQ